MACHKEPPFTAEQVEWIDQRIAEARQKQARRLYSVGSRSPELLAPGAIEGDARG